MKDSRINWTAGEQVGRKNMYDSYQDLIDGLYATPVIVAVLVHQAGKREAKPADGWSALEIVCHMRDVEERALERMRAMRDQKDAFLPAYDQEAWREERNYASADIQEALQAFQHFRAQHIADLSALPVEMWQRTGQHEELGQIDIFHHTLHIVSHDAIHTAQIARL
ncbi:MAG TPA: DinB family protein [Anaerolineaceae bacterium]|nr:DinB family protein [Anaerolineaceae bacterium]